MDWSAITHPTLLLDTGKAQHNLSRMVQKAKDNRCQFRPHFKTHQSAVIGQWFRDYGLDRIAVSSVQMALYFAHHGWRDILVSFPFHPQQWSLLRDLCPVIRVGVVISNYQSALTLATLADQPVEVWFEIDLGQGRTGFVSPFEDTLTTALQAVQRNPNLTIRGMHVHAGQSYQCRGAAALHELGAALQPSLQQIRSSWLDPMGWELSFGDTPLCSVLADLSFADELRPGNFIFYDLMQHQIGACRPEDIAVTLACPVVDEYFLYGGAVHLSGDRLTVDGQWVFGALAKASPVGWVPQEPLYRQPLSALSQEHGWLDKAGPAMTYGKVVPVLPVHSCLTTEAMPYYLTTQGERIEKFSTHRLP